MSSPQSAKGRFADVVGMKKVSLTKVVLWHIYVFCKRESSLFVSARHDVQRIEIIAQDVFLSTNVDLLGLKV